MLALARPCLGAIGSRLIGEAKGNQAVCCCWPGDHSARAFHGLMPPIPLSPETERRVDAVFRGPERDAAIELLTTRCADDLPLWVDATEKGLERIRYAVLKLCRGDLAALERAVHRAQVDWRDVLVAAGFAHSTTAHESWFPD